MGLLGTLMSQQLSFTMTVSAGQKYTHSLGFTPTVILLTQVGSTLGGGLGYTAANSLSVTIISTAAGGLSQNVDVLCGSLHSILQ